MKNLKLKKLHASAILPRYATPGAACFDLHAIEVPAGLVNVYRGAPVVFCTGLAAEIPDGWVMLIFSRSGAGFNSDTRLANATGIIDSDFRGEIKIKLTRDAANTLPLEVRNGDRIAQALMVPAEQWNIEFADELTATARGEGGFGSSGAA